MAAADHLIAAYRSGQRFDRLPLSCRPDNLDAAYAIQDQVAARLGPIGGWKTGQGSADEIPNCAPLLASRIFPSGSSLNAQDYHVLGLEVEFAFQLTRDLPPRPHPYSDAEIRQSLVFVPLIEVIASRYQDRTMLPALEQLADGASNGAVILGSPIADWQAIDFRALRVELAFNGVTVQSAQGSLPVGDPVKLVIWQANYLRETGRGGGLRAGNVVTTGSLQGMTASDPGTVARGDWGIGGTVTLTLT